jgi:hypothetical protein
MTNRDPIAFLSYVHSDDAHDDNRISKLRRSLEGEVKMQTGKPFHIFQDRNDLLWGQNWQERIKETLSEITFLIPVITPSFFLSPACRSEFEIFAKIEQMLGVNRLILPLYYVSCDQLETPDLHPDSVADILRSRQREDWRPFRFSNSQDSDVREALARIASGIKTSIRELRSIAEASQKHSEIAKSPSAAIEKRPETFFSEVPLKNLLDLPIPILRTEQGFDETAAAKPYRIYTKQFDEVIVASDLAGDPGELIKFQRQISRAVTVLEKANDKYLKSLRLIQTTSKRTVAISVLLDNSGSLRGSPHFLAAWSIILMKWFEYLGVKSEVLGFTTRAWKGGQSRERWIADGRPAKPGRLNDLRHIVYKSFDDSADVASPYCAIMMQPVLFKENVDGEALLWAYERLGKIATDEKILCVVSDGAPVDDSTIYANDKNILHNHLKRVATYLQTRPDLTLKAVGIEHDPTPYYEESVTAEISNLGIPILREIEKFMTDADSTG